MKKSELTNYITNKKMGFWTKVCFKCGADLKNKHSKHLLCTPCFFKSPERKAYIKEYQTKRRKTMTPEQRAKYLASQKRYNEIKRGRARKRLAELKESENG